MVADLQSFVVTVTVIVTAHLVKLHPIREHTPHARVCTHTHAYTRTRKLGVPSKRYRTVSVAMLPHADCVATLESCVLWQARIITGAGGKVVVDTSGPALLPALETAPFGWKPNRAELEEFLGGTALLTLSDQLASTKQASKQTTRKENTGHPARPVRARLNGLSALRSCEHPCHLPLPLSSFFSLHSISVNAHT